ncbi:hypothetical protein [Pseudomonas paracarnis]|uniref:hypothetical protein n=1 Tax=Pseudomonas paracarnis TaxID=2750625 RepID=UPI003F8FD291
MAVPLMPPGVSILENMAISNCKRIHLKPGSAFAYSWFYSQVRAAGPWNYKKQGRQYEAFGNFNYGATGTVLAFPKMCCCEPPVWLKPSPERLVRILDHGGAVSLLVMTHGTNIG